ncbi:serine/threonine-protein kinase [Rhodococcus opacus]|uniref:non-specific serine/threonine protein kinase n=1 Tax=Rhodococcus opacus TaxID=37919 RepID=A0AAX3YLZ5_RHOOP|nr:serine/threonine-protein kinase [Rhodococcus opacus]MCZ4590052.1 serine/threonine-protein kinase [Rhodococcus opacus]MDV6247938.1 serine/threonine-protein kinase [Rhodococcus opacus]WKN59005.1 serine/threonine-protein kinase [Rhodococcus opacus]WLF50507.1 serine/threonine-protein kinase [Rhodococcus opacus]
MGEHGPLMPGEVFAGYTIERVLGVGGMGTVYAAAHPRLPRRIALKVLHPALAEDDDARARFEKEADHAARLEHPNIVAVYDRGREGDRLWIAMQYVEGTDAATAAEGGPLDPARAVHIITETAKALDYAHEAGVLHRDVKPANILLEHPRPGHPGDPGRVLLADFGIAKALEHTQHLTKTGMLVASLQYAAPEQFANIPLDARTDVYSLGCTLFRLLTGQQPYPGSTLAQLMAGHLNSPIPRPTAVRAGLPPGFDAVIARAMAKDREDRYPSCGALAAAAQHALGPPQADIPTLVREEPETDRSHPPGPPTPGPSTRRQEETTVRRTELPPEPDQVAQQQIETWAGAGRPDSAQPPLGPPISDRPREHPPHAGRHRAPWWRRPVTPIVAVVVVALCAVGYTLWRGQDTDDRAAQNPGMVFDGMYDAAYQVQATYGGDYSGESEFTARWAVRTHCPAATGACVTSVTATRPDDPSGSPPSQFVMDYSDGTWSGVRELPAIGCQDPATGAPLQDVPSWDSRTLTLDGPQPDGHSLTGTKVEYRGNPCARRYEVGITLRRTGDVDPAIPLTPPTEIAPIGPTSPGAALTGTYNYITTPAVVPPGGGDRGPETLTGRFRTHCLRTGDRCASVFITDANPEGRMHLYADGQWIWTFTAAPRSCLNKPEDPRTTSVNYRTTLFRTGAGEGPAQKLAGRWVETFHGDCPTTYESTVDVTRTGD